MNKPIKRGLLLWALREPLGLSGRNVTLRWSAASRATADKDEALGKLMPAESIIVFNNRAKNLWPPRFLRRRR
jgi:hypothetical protein